MCGRAGLDISCIEATIAAILIKVDTKDYYFKNETDASALVGILDKNDILYTKEYVEINYKEISKSSDIDNQIDEVKKQAEEKAKQEEQKRQRQIQVSTSRSSDNRIQNNNTKSCAVVDYHYISSGYGWRHGKMHTGIDLASNYGTNIHVWKSGKVVFASWSGSYGNFIIVEHNDGTISRYAHLSKYAVSKGDIVDKGQTIGYVGSTGNSTGSHLHFEVLINGEFVNPISYI